MAQVVAVLGKGVVDPAAAILRADDFGAVRGDGVFETMDVRAGVAWQLEVHLQRMVRSAAALDIQLPPQAQLVELADQACQEFGDQHEGALRIVVTRGLETGSEPTVYATVNPVSPAALDARHNGVRLKTLSIGYPFDARRQAPWLLGGAKTLSYAVTMAATRYAVANGYDDALWVSDDGYALEAPTATLLWLKDDTLHTVSHDTGILAGTTVAYLFEHAEQLKLSTAYTKILPAQLLEAEGVWLASSMRGLAPVRAIDGADLEQSPRGTEMLELMGYPTGNEN